MKIPHTRVRGLERNVSVNAKGILTDASSSFATSIIIAELVNAGGTKWKQNPKFFFYGSRAAKQNFESNAARLYNNTRFKRKASFAQCPGARRVCCAITHYAWTMRDSAESGVVRDPSDGITRCLSLCTAMHSFGSGGTSITQKTVGKLEICPRSVPLPPLQVPTHCDACNCVCKKTLVPKFLWGPAQLEWVTKHPMRYCDAATSYGALFEIIYAGRLKSRRRMRLHYSAAI